MNRSALVFPVLLAALLVPTSPAQTVEDTELQVGDNLFQDFFGRSVAVTEEWALIGEPNDMLDSRPLSPGAAFFFRRTADGWREFQQVVPSDMLYAVQFGDQVALDGNIAVIGDLQNDWPLNQRGAAYVFEFRQGRWSQTARLSPDGVHLGDRFGSSVDVDGEQVLICAPNEGNVKGGNGVGYIFERVNGLWTKVAKLLPDLPSDPFGGAGLFCSLSGDVAVMTEQSEAVIVFERIAGVWRQTAILWNPTGTSDLGPVDLDGDTLVVGAPTAAFDNAPGAIAVYQRMAPGQWILHTVRNAPQWDIGGGAGTDRFGEDVAIYGDHILVGATEAADEAGKYVGQAYLFERRPNKWLPIDRFTTTGAKEKTSFLGNAVALSGSFILVGDDVAVGKTPGVRSGAVYVYERALGTTYCPAVPNSAGLTGSLRVTGSLSADVGAIDLEASDLPRHEIGMFLASQSEGFVAAPGGSDGNLCLGSPFARLVNSLGSTGSEGRLEYTLEASIIPLNPPATIQPGESWSFQAWHRDQAAPGGSNFTDAVTVVFE